MEIPRISWSGSFDQAAAESGLTAQGVLAITGRQTIGEWEWQRIGQRINCSRYRGLRSSESWSVDAADIQPFGVAE